MVIDIRPKFRYATLKQLSTCYSMFKVSNFEKKFAHRKCIFQNMSINGKTEFSENFMIVKSEIHKIDIKDFLIYSLN